MWNSLTIYQVSELDWQKKQKLMPYIQPILVIGCDHSEIVAYSKAFIL